MKTTTTIHICFECEQSKNVADCLKSTLENINIKSTKCMGQCEHPCNIALTAPQKMSCLLVNITPENFKEILPLVQEYTHHKKGHLNYTKLSNANQKRYVARIPAS